MNVIREGKGGKGTYVKATDDVLYSKIPLRYAPFGYRSSWRNTAEGQTAQLAVRLKDGSILTNGARFETPIDMHQQEIISTLETSHRRFSVVPFHSITAAWTTLGDKHDASVLYFHAHFRRENPTEMQKDFEILPRTLGKGRFLGANLGMQGNRKLYFDKWWGEGEVKVYLDGDREWPTLAGTGSEDYAGTGWAVKNQYSNLFQGTLIADSSKMRYAFYRYHVPDPIYFRNDIRVTIQQIGHTLETSAEDPLYNTGVPIYKAGVGLVEREKGSFGLFERQDDWSSCAYFYLDKPEDNLPPIQTAEERMKGLDWGGPFFDEVR